MIKNFTLTLFLAFFSLCSFSQNLRKDLAMLNVFSDTDPFYLYVNGILYNKVSTTKIRVESLPKYPYKVEVVFDSRQQASSSISPLNMYNELGQPLELTLLARKERAGFSNMIVFSLFPMDIVMPHISGFEIYAYDSPRDSYTNHDNWRRREKIMSDNDFKIFLKNLKAESFDKDKMLLAENATKDVLFTVSQIEDAIRLFSWDEGKLEFAELMYDKCTDKANYMSLLPYFSFSTSKDQLKAFVARQSGNREHSITMNTSAFDNFINGLKNESFDEDKVNYVSAIKSSSRFSVAQVKVIMKNLSFDDGKLRVAEMLYPNCTDKHLYYTLAEELSFSSNKTKLQDFIRNYK